MMKGNWRQSASIILAAPRPVPTPRFAAPETGQEPFGGVAVRKETAPQTTRQPPVSDLLAFVVQRSSKARFMPRAFVFPGGVIERAVDCDRFWADRQREVEGVSSDGAWKQRLEQVTSFPQPRPPIYDEYRHNDAVMPAEWALRVCAARELYEECGIVPVVDVKTGEAKVLSVAELDGGHGELALFQNAQTVARDNATAFVDLFRRSERYALNFTALVEWSNWLTPRLGVYNRRFDTIFFLLTVNDCPKHKLCDEELQGAQWTSPVNILREGYYGSAPVPPPQVYELSRLARFETCGELEEFAAARAARAGMVRYCPQMIFTSDAVRVTLFPGDDHYELGTKENPPEMIEERKLDMSADELRQQASLLHRAEFRSLDGQERGQTCPWTRWRIYAGSFKDGSDHIAPISEP
uniref:Nudix hydrolase domain-containing protein n=1 Tax=Plectus sambesii TaxID=2011161 RepID=A0A914WL45_9BILA